MSSYLLTLACWPNRCHCRLQLTLAENLHQCTSLNSIILHRFDRLTEILPSDSHVASNTTVSEKPKTSQATPIKGATIEALSAESKIDEVAVRSKAAISEANNPCKSSREAISFAADVYLGTLCLCNSDRHFLINIFRAAYVFWSIFTSLAPTLFYFSIWELGIAGSELSLLSILSPCLLGISPFRRWCQTKAGRITLHVLSLSALISYALPQPQHRLLLVALGNIFLCIGAVADWSGGGGASVHYQAIRMLPSVFF
jgi:hypothetical protein